MPCLMPCCISQLAMTTLVTLVTVSSATTPFQCTPASDVVDLAPIVNDNKFNAVGVSSAAGAHCEGLISPSTNGSIPVDRSCKVIYLKYLASDGAGGWSTVLSAAGPENYKGGDCTGKKDGWSIFTIPKADAPLCDTNKHCSSFPSLPSCVNGTCQKTSPTSLRMPTFLADTARRQLLPRVVKPASLSSSSSLSSSPLSSSSFFPKVCPIMGLPSPHYCSCSTGYMEGYPPEKVYVETKDDGIFTTCFITRLCDANNSQWMAMERVPNTTNLPISSFPIATKNSYDRARVATVATDRTTGKCGVRVLHYGNPSTNTTFFSLSDPDLCNAARNDLLDLSWDYQ